MLSHPKTLTLILFLLTFCILFLLILFSLLFMLRICSGYLGCGLHYGRNGSPQNPFSRKGLYPWAACSSVWHFLWNKQHRKKSSQIIIFILNGSHKDHTLWATIEILFLGFAWHLDLHPPTCSSYRYTNSHGSLLTHISSSTGASSSIEDTLKTQNRIQ